MPKSVTLKGEAVALSGTEVKVGDALPDAKLSKNPKEDVTLSSYKGKTLIVASVPSLDTGVCDLEAKRLDKEAAALGDHVKVLVISRDLPPAQARWCGAAEAKAIEVLSDYKHRDFGPKFGTEIPALGLLCRAIFVADASGKVKHVEYVSEISEQPDFDAALAAAKG